MGQSVDRRDRRDYVTVDDETIATAVGPIVVLLIVYTNVVNGD